MLEVEQIQTCLVLLFASIIFFILGQQWSNSNQPHLEYDSLRSDDESQNYEQQIAEYKKKEEDYKKQIEDLRKQLGIDTRKNSNIDR